MFENDSLHAKIEELKQELKDGKKEIDKTTDDYLKLKVLCTRLNAPELPSASPNFGNPGGRCTNGRIGPM